MPLVGSRPLLEYKASASCPGARSHATTPQGQQQGTKLGLLLEVHLIQRYLVQQQYLNLVVMV